MDSHEHPPGSLKIAVPGAVRALRASLGESQQVFETRIGISIRALANYEKDRLPNGKALFKMMDLAAESNREDWLVLFRRAALAQFESESFEVVSKAYRARECLFLLHKSVKERVCSAAG
jgi:transcriptional regulator with XRE-family HTH domain